MAKRLREQELVDDDRLTKRPRPLAVGRLSSLSDELSLRILSHLPVSDLVRCQRLSRRYRVLGGDKQIWKNRYYEKFVAPRASRLPRLKELDEGSSNLRFPSKVSRWLDEEHLVRHGAKTDWKRQYRLRQNWSRGSCAVNEIEVADQAPIPPVLVEMHAGTIYLADQTDGLRAWSAKGSRLLACSSLHGGDHGPPTSLAVDTEGDPQNKVHVMLGFEDGTFSLYALVPGERSFAHQYSHAPSRTGVLSAVGLKYPFAVTMTATQLLSVYCFEATDGDDGATSPRLLHSLKSHSIWPPMSISLRAIEFDLAVSIAYTIPTYLSGWTVGMQEVRLGRDGRVRRSRLTSAIDQHYRPLALTSPPFAHHLSSTTSPATGLRHMHAKPTSLSYAHPYLLASHPDNTLTLYLVTSTADTLVISAGSRLWGHSSSVSGAHVGGRGKAVSVSRRGDELRVWELEGGFTSSAAKRRLARGNLSVPLRPERRQTSVVEVPRAGLDLVSGPHRHLGLDAARNGKEEAAELTLSRGWIGFDDENVVVLREQNQGRQALVVYDFT